MLVKPRRVTAILTMGGLAMVVGCQGSPQLGAGGSMVQGAAGGGAAGGGPSTETTAELVRCRAPIGNASLIEPRADLILQLHAIDLESPTPLLRLMMAQSNCFQVVDMAAIVEPGARAKVHYSIRPNIVFSDPAAGGYGGLAALGSAAFGFVGALAGAAAGSVRISEAQTVLFLNDATTGLQQAAAEGSAEITDFGGTSGLLGWGDSFAKGGVGGYGRTAEGKLITAAFLDAYNKLVGQLGAAVIETAGRSPAPSGPPILAPGTHYTPDMLINVRGGPGTDHQVVGSVGPGATLTATGETDDGWWQVDDAGHLGWVPAKRLRAR